MFLPKRVILANLVDWEALYLTNNMFKFGLSLYPTSSPFSLPNLSYPVRQSSHLQHDISKLFGLIVDLICILLDTSTVTKEKLPQIQVATVKKNLY